MLLPVSRCALQPTTTGGAAPSFVPGDKIEAWCYLNPGEVNPMQGKHTWTVNADGSISNDVYLGVDGAPIDPTTVQATACLPCGCAGVPPTPPAPLSLTGQDCDGNHVTVEGAVGSLTSVVQAAGTVFKVQLCEPLKDVEKVILCDNKGTGHKVAVISDLTNPLAPVVTTWDLHTGAPWQGDIADLETCADTDLESDPVEMCDAGTTFLRWIVKKNGQPTGEKYDTTLAGAPYTVTNEAALTAGQCQLACLPTISSAPADNLAGLLPGTSISIQKGSCCALQVATTAGNFIVSKAVTGYSTADFKCPVEVTAVTVLSGTCDLADVIVTTQA